MITFRFEYTAETFIQILQSVDSFDCVELKANLALFSIEPHGISDLSILRNLLKKRLLEELINDEALDRIFYENCLRDVRNQLDVLKGRVERLYTCCFVGCGFQAERHRDYITHIRRCHPNLKNILCNFKKDCHRRFRDISTLVEHVKSCHVQSKDNQYGRTGIAVADYNNPCKCNRISCGSRHFDSLKELMSHYNTFHSREERSCIFDGCSTKFHPASPMSATNHFRLKHKQTGKLALKACYLLTPNIQNGTTDVSIECVSTSET